MDINKAMKNPPSVFVTPEALSESTELTAQQKRAVLLQSGPASLERLPDRPDGPAARSAQYQSVLGAGGGFLPHPNNLVAGLLQIPLLARTRLIGGRDAGLDRGGLSKLNPRGAAGQAGTISRAYRAMMLCSGLKTRSIVDTSMIERRNAILDVERALGPLRHWEPYEAC